MSVVERQVHGYRHGHQLLAASAQLPKDDQSVVDRLSDVAGPLRPRETFEPYLTAYPLPSGERFVLARTWQDLTVPRAGCVRTLSLIIPICDWAVADDPSAFIDLLGMDRLPDEGDATGVTVSSAPPRRLPPAPDFSGSELLEALFLEESLPVVVLDAPDTDLIATRLITALWPSVRCRFAVSTFALSPRKVAGRDFDLVFAPKDARAKFTDWNGRRVNGRSVQSGRHRWTSAIVKRVFEQPIPRLLSASEVGLVSGGAPMTDADNSAALRIALLWDELVGKLETTPTAALGLLDIANSGKVRDTVAIKVIEPSLAYAAHRASTTFSEDEAWSFLNAMARKLQGSSMPNGRGAVAQAVEELAGRAPEGAVALLAREDSRGVAMDLLPRIAAGIGETFTDRSERALVAAPPAVLGRLLSQGGPLVKRAAGDRPLIDRLGEALPEIDDDTLAIISREMLPMLTQDWQLPAVTPLIANLDGAHLVSTLRHLGEVNDFAAGRLADLVFDLAVNASSRQQVRSALVTLAPSVRRNDLIARTLEPVVDDARWLLGDQALDRQSAAAFLVGLLRRATDSQFATLLADGIAGPGIIDALEADASDLLLRATTGDTLPLWVFVRVLPRVLTDLDPVERVKLAKHGLTRCLGARFGGDESAFLVALLSAVGDQLDGAWAARLGLSKNIDAAIASRNMIAFRKASQPARLRVVWSIAEVAQVLRDRRSFDLDAAATQACAAFMFDAEKVSPRSLLETVMNLWRAQRPVSS